MSAAPATSQPVQPINAHAGALWAAKRGLRVLRVAPGGKVPYRDGVNEATTDAATIERWFAEEPRLNYGIAMGGPDRLVALDCDTKHACFHVEYLGLGYPTTLEFESCSGGAHIVFSVDFDAGQKDLAGATSINVRAEGGYIVGPGSTVDGKRYRIVADAPIANAPDDLAGRISRRGEKAADNSTPIGEQDTLNAMAQALRIVAEHPGVDEGGRDNECFRVACRVKDEGVSEPECLGIMKAFNAEKCNPPQPDGDIERVVSSAYRNGQRPPGAANPANEFEPVGPIATKPSAPAAIRATPYVWADPEGIPPRDWLYGRHLIRKFVSATVAPGGIGKSSLVLGEALSIATGRGLLIDRAPQPGRVWWWNGEDPYDELQRRVQAVCRRYGITRDAIEGRLFVDSGRATPIVIATETKHGAKIAEPVVDQVKATIRENAIDVFVVDPFVSCHRVSENDNNKIEAVAWEWAKIADECGCAIELVHHTRKTGGAEITAEDSRGASALGGKARSVRVLNRMTKEEGDRAGVDNNRLYFRVDNGKGNMAPPSDAATWYRLEGVGLCNGTAQHPEDEVAVVVPWEWPDEFDGLPDDAVARAQLALAEGEWRADVRASDWAGHAVARALGLDTDKARDRERVKTLLARWIEQGAFVAVEGKDKKSMPRTYLKPMVSTV